MQTNEKNHIENKLLPIYNNLLSLRKPKIDERQQTYICNQIEKLFSNGKFWMKNSANNEFQ